MRRILPSIDTITLSRAETGWRPLNQEISGEEKREARVPASLSECACVLWIRGRLPGCPYGAALFQALEKA